MQTTAAHYCDAIHKRYQEFRASWPPDAPLQLGDFGYLNDGVFVRKSHIATLGVSFDVIKSGGRSTYSLTDSEGTTVALRARGSVEGGGTPIAKARAEVSFGKAGAVFMSAAGCIVEEITDQIAFGNTIIGLFDKRQWNDDWWIIVRAVTAKSSTVAISESANASVHFEAKADIAEVDLADAGVRLVASNQRNVTNVIASKGNLTPLIGLARVRKRLLGNRVLGLTESENIDLFELRARLTLTGKSVADQVEFARE